MRVSRDTGRSLADVADDSYALTLFTWGHLVADARRDRLLRQGEFLSLAADIAIAFHEPKKLRDRNAQYLDELGMRETAEDAVSNGIALAAKLALAEEMNRVVASQSPEPQPGGME